MDKRGDGSIDPKALKALLLRVSSVKAELSEIQSDLTKDVNEAAVTRGLHRGAFALCARLNRMKPDKRLAFVRALQSYIEILNLDVSPQTEIFEDEGQHGQVAA